MERRLPKKEFEYLDGNGTERFTALNIEIPSDNSGANSSHVTDQKFTYTVNGDGTWSIPGSGSITGHVDDGPRAGQDFTIFPVGPSFGHISTNAATLTLSTVTPTIETITYTIGSPPVLVDTLYRICNRSSVHISLPPGQ